MQIALNIGTINIQNQDVAKFIQNKSIEEIKALFLNFLTKEVKTVQQKPKHEWAEFGDKMYGRISEKRAKELKEERDEFQELSNLSLAKIWDNKEDEIYDKFLR